MSAWSVRVDTRLGDLHLRVALEGDLRPVALLGPNGSGKTTLLRIIAGAHEADEAEITCGTRVLTSTARRIAVSIEARRVGYLPQGYALFPHLRVEDNVAFGLSTGSGRLPRAEGRARARALLDTLGCGELARRWPAGLSGGERQRVALARALLPDPALLLLDEPLAALDAAVRRSTRRALAERLKAAGRPCLVVTHDLRDVAALDATVVLLEAGKVAYHGELEGLRAAPPTEFAAELVGAE